MSAFKQFTTKEVVITPFDANKKFSFVGNALTASDVGIEVYAGQNPTSSLFISSSSTPTGFVSIQNTTGVYNSVKQLYYTNYLTSSLGDNAVTQSIVPGVTRDDDEFVGPIQAPRYNNYLQSSLTQSRYFPTGIGNDGDLTVVSIPSKLFGENIVPSTFDLTYTSSGDLGFNIVDDGEGNLVINSITGSAGYGSGVYGTLVYGAEGGNIGDVVGQIFYSHGIAVFTTSSMAALGAEMSSSLSNLSKLSVNFSSSIRIYENQYKCVINENEFQFSLNPTLLSGSLDDVYYSYVTGSTFTPYITTVGLYNESNELLVVGKLSSAIPIAQQTDTTIIVNFDT
jgi:hypothetical protein